MGGKQIFDKNKYINPLIYRDNTLKGLSNQLKKHTHTQDTGHTVWCLTPNRKGNIH